jgi:hypothetical protein
MARKLCAILLLIAGCALVTEHPANWVARNGSSPADPLDYDDCLRKARNPEMVASDSEVPLDSLPQTDRTLLEVCMQAHGYQLRGSGPGR